jgi:hypothetical protein
LLNLVVLVMLVLVIWIVIIQRGVYLENVCERGKTTIINSVTSTYSGT